MLSLEGKKKANLILPQEKFPRLIRQISQSRRNPSNKGRSLPEKTRSRQDGRQPQKAPISGESQTLTLDLEVLFQIYRIKPNQESVPTIIMNTRWKLNGSTDLPG